MKLEYTKAEIRDEIADLENTFDTVRIVDPILCDEYGIRSEKEGYSPTGCFCFQIWEKNERCKNCISALALSQKSRLTKFEYCGNSLYYIITRYIEVEGNKYVLECVSKLDKEFTRSFFNNDERTKKILELYQEVRIDSLTGLYNRRYLSEKLQTLMIEARTQQTCHPTIAFMDIDDLSLTNDKYGRLAGDAIIASVAETIIREYECEDDGFAARMSDDQFVICASNSSTYKMKKIIERLVIEVSRTNVKNYPQLKPSVSVGIADFSEAKSYDEIIMLADKRLKKAKLTRHSR